MELMKSLAPKFTDTNYDLFKNNCNNFTDEVSKLLFSKGIPSDITSLPSDFMNSPFGASLMPIVQQMSDNFKIKSNHLFDKEGKVQPLEKVTAEHTQQAQKSISENTPEEA